MLCFGFSLNERHLQSCMLKLDASAWTLVLLNRTLHSGFGLVLKMKANNPPVKLLTSTNAGKKHGKEPHWPVGPLELSI